MGLERDTGGLWEENIGFRGVGGYERRIVVKSITLFKE